jgi:WD40 repeat protein
LVKLWDLATGGLAAELGVPGVGNVYPVFRPDGKQIAITDDKRTTLYDLRGSDVQQTIAHHTHPVRAMAFAADGKSLACLAQEAVHKTAYSPAELTHWEVASGRRLSQQVVAQSLKPCAWAQPSLAFHPGGAALACTAPRFYGVQQVDPGGERHRSLGDLPLARSLAFSPTGRKLWGILDSRKDNELRKDAPDTDQVVSLSWPELEETSRWVHRSRPLREVSRLAVGERRVVAGLLNGTTKLLRAGDGQLEKDWCNPGEFPVRSVALSADERVAASGTQKGLLQIVRVPEGEVMAGGSWPFSSDRLLDRRSLPALPPNSVAARKADAFPFAAPSAPNHRWGQTGAGCRRGTRTG